MGRAWGVVAAVVLAAACGDSFTTGVSPGSTGGGDDQASSSPSSSSTAGGAGGSGGDPVEVGGTGGTGGAGGGCIPVDEECTNGVDDDCDDEVDCDDPDCTAAGYICKEIPDGAKRVAVASGPGQCVAPLVEVELVECSACECAVEDKGSCTFDVDFYDNDACAGSPVESVEVTPGTVCAEDDLGIEAVNDGTVGAIANPVGLGDNACAAEDPTAPVAPVYLCQVATPGKCTGDGVCAPAAANCLLFTGDVACPDTMDKQLVYEPSAATMCTCSCGPGQQDCATNKVTRPFQGEGCEGEKFDLVGDGQCQDTGFNTIESLENKDADVGSLAAGCENTSGPLVIGGGPKRSAVTEPFVREHRRPRARFVRHPHCAVC